MYLHKQDIVIALQDNLVICKDTQIQHRGYGKLLIENAEKISTEDFDAKKLAVISGIGAKSYFYEMGYKPDGVYVSKQLYS